jgi:hypothetical protein
MEAMPGNFGSGATDWISGLMGQLCDAAWSFRPFRDLNNFTNLVPTVITRGLLSRAAPQLNPDNPLFQQSSAFYPLARNQKPAILETFEGVMKCYNRQDG